MFGPEENGKLKISPQVRALFSLISDISENANFSGDRFHCRSIIVCSRIRCSLMLEKKTIICERSGQTADAEG